MEKSPCRELRNRVKQSPVSSPTNSKSSPQSSPNHISRYQQQKSPTCLLPIQSSPHRLSLPNGAFRPKTTVVSNVHVCQSQKDLGEQSNPIVIENEIQGNKMNFLQATTPHMRENESCSTTTFQPNGILMDKMTKTVITQPAMIPKCVKSLDINSNMDHCLKIRHGSGNYVFSTPSTSGATKRSRKQSSPKRARTALTSPVGQKSVIPTICQWESKLEYTPTNTTKRNGKLQYVALDDSPVIDLTSDTYLSPIISHGNSQSGKKYSFASPMSYQTSGMGTNTCTPSRNVESFSWPSPLATEKIVTKSSPSPRNKKVHVLSQEIKNAVRTRQSPKQSPKSKTSVSVNNSPRSHLSRVVEKSSPRQQKSLVTGLKRPRETNSPKKSRSPAVRESPRSLRSTAAVDYDSPRCKRPRIVTDSPTTRTNSPMNVKKSPKSNKVHSPYNQKSEFTARTQTRSPKNMAAKSDDTIKKTQVCRNLEKESQESLPQIESSPAKNFMDSFQAIISDAKVFSPSKAQVGKQNNASPVKVNSPSKHSKSFLESSKAAIDNLETESVSKEKVDSVVKEKVKTPVKVKVEPSTPPSESCDFSDIPDIKNEKVNDEKINRRIVRPRKTECQQKKSSCGRGRPPGSKKKKVMLSPCKFQTGQEVLARWYDGLFYLGSVIKVDERGRKCFVRFEDDSEYWILFKDLQKGAKEGDVSCCLCQTDVSEKPNEIVLCDNCGLGYHQECHNPNISSEVLHPDIEWCCRLCVFAAAVKKGGALKNGPDAKALQKMKQTFPYDINKLTWDAQHKTNVEQCYCYCGGPGNWFLKMLQCCRCRQWFHEACIQCLQYPLMNGDRFYLFVCSHCNTGPEYIKRLDLKWVDIVHLTLYNLTIEGRWNKFYDVDCVKDFITSNWEMLQIDCLSEDRDDVREKVESCLERYKSRFVNQKEHRKKSQGKSNYGLRVRIPPPAPAVMLPHTGQVNHEIMMSLKEKGKNLKCFFPSPCKSPVSVPWQNKQKGLEKDVSLAFKSDKVRKNLLQCTIENQDYKGYTGENCVLQDYRQPTLDTMIPPPNNFDGFNHPFKNFFEQEEEYAHHKRKNEIINYLYMEYESDMISQSSVESAFSLMKDDPTKVIPTPPPSVTSYTATQDVGKVKARGRKRKAVDTPSEPVRQSKRKRTNTTYFNVVDPQTIESVGSHTVNMGKIKNNMCQYFGAAERLRKGEKYEVMGKHVTPDGKIKYLIHWVGLQTK